jgi:MFS family permease
LGIALIFLYFALLGVVSNTLFFAKVLSRVAPVPAMRVLLIVGIPTLLLYGALGGRSVVALYLALTLDMLTLSLVPALVEGQIGSTADEHERGEVFGLAQAIAALMTVVAAIVATGLSTIDLRLPFVVFALATALALSVTFALRPQPKLTAEG